MLERRIGAHLRFLASDALNGRGSGTRDEWIAATYIGAQLAALGLEPMGDDGWFVQEVGVQRFKAATPPVLTAGDRTYTRNTAFLVGAVNAARVTGPLQHFVAGATVSSGAAVILPADTPMTAMSALTGAALVLRKATTAQAGNWAQLTAQASEWLSTQVVGTSPAPPLRTDRADARRGHARGHQRHGRRHVIATGHRPGRWRPDHAPGTSSGA